MTIGATAQEHTGKEGQRQKQTLLVHIRRKYTQKAYNMQIKGIEMC